MYTPFFEGMPDGAKFSIETPIRLAILQRDQIMSGLGKVLGGRQSLTVLWPKIFRHPPFPCPSRLKKYNTAADFLHLIAWYRRVCFWLEANDVGDNGWNEIQLTTGSEESFCLGKEGLCTYVRSDVC